MDFAAFVADFRLEPSAAQRRPVPKRQREQAATCTPQENEHAIEQDEATQASCEPAQESPHFAAMKRHCTEASSKRSSPCETERSHVGPFSTASIAEASAKQVSETAQPERLAAPLSASRGEPSQLPSCSSAAPSARPTVAQRLEELELIMCYREARRASVDDFHAFLLSLSGCSDEEATCANSRGTGDGGSEAHLHGRYWALVACLLSVQVRDAVALRAVKALMVIHFKFACEKHETPTLHERSAVIRG